MIVYEDSTYKATVQASSAISLYGDSPLLACLVEFSRLVDLFDCALIRVKQESADTYSYRIKLSDGRLWKQTMLFDIGDDPLMTFDVTSQWRLSEFSEWRAVRDILIQCVVAYAPTLIEIEKK